MDIKKFIIKEFGLPEDVGFNKVPKVTYFDIFELLTKFEEVSQQKQPASQEHETAELCPICKTTYLTDRVCITCTRALCTPLKSTEGADLPQSFKDLFRSMEDSSIQITLYGNDGFDNQEQLDGKGHMVKWIIDAWSDYASQCQKEVTDEKKLLMDFCFEYKAYFHSILALKDDFNYEIFIDKYLSGNKPCSNCGEVHDYSEAECYRKIGKAT